jgi:ATP-dependent DNA helicase RecG
VKTREKILKAIAEDGTVTIESLTQQLGITRKGVEWQISKLKSAGILERIGPDNGGFWKIHNIEEQDNGRR